MNEPKCPCVPTNILLSFVTSPFLLGLIAAKSLADTVIEMGEASEELFRGDRLPILNVRE